MTLTVRSATVTGATTKGSPLSHAELDENFNHLSQAANISVTQSGSESVERTVEEKLQATVSVEDKGAVGDGTTDDSDAFLAAIATLPDDGGVVELEGAKRYKVTLGAITKPNVCLRGKGFVENTALSAQLIPADNDEFVLEVGDGTTLCRGFRMEGVSLNGLASGKKGLKINGADRCHYSRFSAAGFTEQGVYITSSASQPTAYQFFDTFSISAQNGATAIGLEIDYGSQFVAAIFFNNGTIGCQSSSLWALKQTRVRAFYSNVWVQGANTGNVISLNTDGGTAAVMECANVHVDTDDSGDVLVNVDSNTRVNTFIRGTVRIDGLVAMPGGNTAALSDKTVLPANSYLTSCFVNGSGLFFITGTNEWERWDQSATNCSITRSTGGNLTFTAPAGVVASVTPATGQVIVTTNGQATSTRFATASVNTTTGGTVSASNLIPANSLVLGVTIRVTTLVTGATSISIGDGSDADRWGTGIAVAAGTTTNISDFTITSPVYYGSATNVVLTAAGSDFTAGAVRITVHYISLTAATS